METIVGNKAVNNIINTIEKTHPMKKPRVDVDEEPSKLPEMEIILRIFTEGNKLTAVTILDGNGVYKKGILESKQIIDGFISETDLSNLINYILKHYPYIDSFSNSTNSIRLGFTFSLDENLFSEEDLSINRIVLNIETFDTNLAHQMREYLKFIIINYREQLATTLWYETEYKKYYTEWKQKCIDGMSREDIIDFLNTLSTESLKTLLSSIANERFIEILKEQEKKSKSQSIKLLKQEDNKRTENVN